MRTGQSTGLGLAIVKALAERMGHTVAARWEQGVFPDDLAGGLGIGGHSLIAQPPLQKLARLGGGQSQLGIGKNALRLPVIGIIQQLRSRATLEKLTLLSEARVKVVRDGQLGVSRYSPSGIMPMRAATTAGTAWVNAFSCTTSSL